MSKFIVMVVGTVGLVGAVGSCSSSSSTRESVGSSTPATATETVDSSSVAVDTSEWSYVFGLHKLMHPSCIHQIPNGAEGREDGTVWLNGTMIASYGDCAFPAVSPHPTHILGQVGGWVENTNENIPTPGDSFTTMTSTWTVPPLPAANNQFMGFFTSFQTWSAYYGNPSQSDPEDIAQPVLQYGYNPGQAESGELGPWWDIVSWEIINADDCLKMPPVGCQVYTSSPLLVQPGDTIQGDLYELEQQINIGGTWYCYPNNTVVEVQDLTPPDVEYAWIIEPWANWQTAQSGVLEAYGTPPQCSDFPPSNSISFTQPTNMYENGPPWLCGATNANQGPWTTLSGGSPPDAWATLISTCSISPTVGPSGNATLQWTY